MTPDNTQVGTVNISQLFIRAFYLCEPRTRTTRNIGTPRAIEYVSSRELVSMKSYNNTWVNLAPKSESAKIAKRRS